MCFFLCLSFWLHRRISRIRYRQYSATPFDPFTLLSPPPIPLPLTTLDALNARYSFINGSKQFGNNDVHIAIYCHRNAPQASVFHSKRKFTFVICILIVFDFLFFSSPNPISHFLFFFRLLPSRYKSSLLFLQRHYFTVSKQRQATYVLFVTETCTWRILL